MVSFSSVLVTLCVSLCLVDAISPKPVMEMLQQQITKKANQDCSTCNKANQFCDYRSWTTFCKECPVCGVDHFCDSHGTCKRCPGAYTKPTQVCERINVNDPKSDATFTLGKAVKLAFSTVGDDLFYLAAEPNTTDSTVVSTPPSGNTTGNVTATLRAAVDAILSVTPSSHNIEEITEGSGQYRVSFNDTLGGYLRVVLPATTSDDSTGGVTSLIDLKTLGVAQIFRDFNDWTVFGVEHSASFSWRFRVGNDDTAKYLAWCGQSTCGQGCRRSASCRPCSAAT